MTEIIKANESACTMCAAKEGLFCLPWKLGQSNRKGRSVFGRSQKSGTTMRPINCPHPENKVSTVRNSQAMLTQLLRK